jgi:hypothetical protein
MPEVREWKWKNRSGKPAGFKGEAVTKPNK